MATQSVNELAWVINQNQIDETLLKADALLQMGLNSELQAQPAYVLHGYLWVLSDLISNARKLI